MTQQESTGRILTGSARLSGAGSSFQDSQAQGTQEWSPAQGEHELKSVTAERQFVLDRLQAEAGTGETAEDNKRRRERERMLFYVVVALMVAGLAAGILIGTMSQNAETRRFGQAIVTLILGAVAGYFTGRAGK